MEEEEEMWFNEEDDFDDTEPVLPPSNDILTKKLDTDLESIGKIIDTKKTETNGPKINNNTSPKSTLLNNNASNNATGGQTPGTPVPNENKSLFKRVSKFYLES